MRGGGEGHERGVHEQPVVRLHRRLRGDHRLDALRELPEGVHLRELLDDLLGLLRRLGEPVRERGEDVAHPDARFQERARVEELLERPDVELIREHLHDGVHQVRLRDLVLAVDHLLQNPGQHHLVVQREVHPLELRQDEEVLPDEVAQLAPLPLAPLAVALRPAVLHPHPELVHLREVLKDEIHGVADVPALALVLRPGVRQQRLAALAQVRAEEQAVDGLLHAFGHLHEILQDVLRRALLGLDVHASHGDEQVQAREDVPGVLHELVHLEVTLPVPGPVAEEHLQVAQLAPHLHVELVVLLRAQGDRAKLAEHQRTLLQGLAEVIVVLVTRGAGVCAGQPRGADAAFAKRARGGRGEICARRGENDERARVRARGRRLARTSARFM